MSAATANFTDTLRRRLRHIDALADTLTDFAELDVDPDGAHVAALGEIIADQAKELRQALEVWERETLGTSPADVTSVFARTREAAS